MTKLAKEQWRFILLLVFCTMGLYCFLSIFIDLAEFIRFQDRDITRAYNTLRGKFIWHGPEISGGATLPSALAYYFNSIPLLFGGDWKSIIKFNLFLTSIGTAFLFCIIWRIQTLGVALFWLFVYGFSPVGPFFFNYNLHPSYLLFFNPIVTGLIWWCYFGSYSKTKFYSIVLLIVAASHMHTTGGLLLLFLASIHFFSNKPNLDFYKGSLLFILLTQVPMIFSDAMSSHTVKINSGYKESLISAAYIATNNMNSPAAKEALRFVFENHLKLIVVMLAFSLLLLYLNFKNFKNYIINFKLKTISKTTALAIALLLLSCLFAVMCVIDDSCIRYVVNVHFLLVIFLTYVFVKLKQFQKYTAWLLVFVSLWLSYEFFKKKHNELLVRSSANLNYLCELGDFEVSGAYAKDLENLSSYVKNQTHWSYEELISNAITLRNHGINSDIAFRNIYNNIPQTDSAEVARNPHNGIILIDSRLLCIDKKINPLKYQEAIEKFKDFFPEDFKLKIADKKIKFFEPQTFNQLSVILYQNLNEQEKYKIQNFGFSYEEMFETYEKYNSLLKLSKNPNQYIFKWNNCVNNKYCDMFFILQTEKLSQKKTLLKYSIFNAYTSMPDLSYSPLLMQRYENIYLEFKCNEKPENKLMALYIGSNPSDEDGKYIRTPFENSLVVECPENRFKDFYVSYGSGGGYSAKKYRFKNSRIELREEVYSGSRIPPI